MIAPSVVKFEPDHFICGNTFRCVWALREYPTQTDEQAILRHLGEKDGITLRIYTRQVTPAEEKRIIQNAANKNRMGSSNTNDLQQTITAESNLQDVASFPAVSKNNGMRRLFDTFSQMRNTQAIHCGRKHIPAIHFPQPGIKILGSMNSFMRWGLILQLSQKKPLSRHSNWRRNGNPLTGRSTGVNHIHYPRKYHAVTAAALIAEKNKYPRRIGAVENMIHP